MKRAILVFALFACMPELRAAELPVVVAGFEFEGGTCGTLRDERLSPSETVYAAAMKQLAPIIKEEIERNHKFVDWRTPETLKGADRVATFTAKLRSVQQGRSQAYYLVYWREVGPQAGVMDIGGSRTELYSAGSFDQPCELAADFAKGIKRDDITEFLNRIRGRIAADLTAFDMLFIDYFFEEIPLLRAAPEGDDDLRKVLIDLPWKYLHAAAGSVIHVTVANNLRLMLTPLDREPKTKTPRVAGDVHYFWAEGIGKLDRYDPRIKPVLEQDRRRRDVLMTMNVFRQNSNTDMPE